MRVVQAIASINEATGGTAVSVTSLAASLADQGHESTVVALDYPNLGAPRPAGDAEVHLSKASRLVQRLGGVSPSHYRLLVEQAFQADILHNHGVWLPPNRYARVAARRAGIPLIISPRGMLEPWSLRRGRVKKFAAWHLYERKNLYAAAAFHATSEDEARSIRARGMRAPIAVIPNGVALPNTLTGTRAAELRMQLPGVNGQRYALFLSRLHPKKGIENLLDAWRVIRSEGVDVHLLIAGPDLTGYRPKLEARTRDLGLADSVSFAGPIDGDLKAAAFQNADVFVLPSYSENFGIVIAEALAHALPVITTTATPWSDLAEQRCGWWIGLGVEPLVQALREALALPPLERTMLGRRGQAFVRERFSWPMVAARMAELYKWVRDDGCRASQAPQFLAD